MSFLPRIASNLSALLAGIAMQGAAGLAAQAVPPSWRLSPSPILSLGGKDDSRHEFLRVGSLQLLPDGSVLVANGEPPELRLFGPGGALKRQFGRVGEGPGEFRWLSWAAVSGDSVLAFDLGQRRLVVFARDGRILPAPPRPASDLRLGLKIVGRLACGSWLAEPVQAMGRPGQRGPLRDSIGVLLLSSGMDRVEHTLGSFPGVTTVTLSSGEGRTRRMAVGVTPFYATTLTGVSDSLVFTLDTATPDLTLWDCAGRRRMTVVLPMPDRPLSSAVVTRLKEREARNSRGEAERAFVEMRYAQANLPSRLPRVRSIVPGVRGELWVEQYEPDPQARATWWVIDRRGLVVATLATPEGFRIRSVLHDRVGGVHTDADGLESIRAYGIVR
jgi:hypothetical protein